MQPKRKRTQPKLNTRNSVWFSPQKSSTDQNKESYSLFGSLPNKSPTDQNKESYSLFGKSSDSLMQSETPVTIYNSNVTVNVRSNDWLTDSFAKDSSESTRINPMTWSAGSFSNTANCSTKKKYNIALDKPFVLRQIKTKNAKYVVYPEYEHNEFILDYSCANSGTFVIETNTEYFKTTKLFKVANNKGSSDNYTMCKIHSTSDPFTRYLLDETQYINVSMDELFDKYVDCASRDLL